MNQKEDSFPINKSAKWTDEETKSLLELYAEYFPQVGLTLRFRNKKTMNEAISRCISKEFNNIELRFNVKHVLKQLKNEKLKPESITRLQEIHEKMCHSRMNLIKLQHWMTVLNPRL